MIERRRKAAFTLVELILAATLTVLVAGSSALILRSVTGVRVRVDRQMAVQQEARAAVRAIACALRNAYRSAEDEWALEGVAGRDGPLPADRIRLLAVSRRTVRRDQPESDVREFEFALARLEDEPLPVLVRRTDPTRNERPDGGGVVERVAGGVIALAFEYHDGAAWREDWPETSRLWPAAVRVHLIVTTEQELRKTCTVSRTVNFPYRPGSETPKENEPTEPKTR